MKTFLTCEFIVINEAKCSKLQPMEQENDNKSLTLVPGLRLANPLGLHPALI